MKTLVVFDSNFGNTKLIAEKIAERFGEGAKSVFVNDFKDSDLAGAELLVLGSPIIGWKPSENMGKFLAKLEGARLKGIKAAAFDTRIKLFVHGDAAGKISKMLESARAEIVAGPQAFYVRGKEGPLFEGEIERAAAWAESVRTKLSHI